VVVNSWTGPRFTLRRAGADGHRLALEAWLREEPARRLLAAAGRDLEALTAAAARPGFRAMPLGLTASIGLDSRLREVVSRNVVGWLPGRERPAETVLFSAHWDHFGTVENPAGDGIYNGAADNATGVAALLEQARIAAGDATPPRSLAFAAFTAEEYGLLGSLHFAENSPFPLPTMVAVLNMDRMNHLGRARDVLVRGYGASELDAYLVEAAARQDRIVVGDPFPERGLYFRSDHFSLARFGVPGLHARSGVDDRERGRAWGVERENDYLRRLYHTPDDEYSRDWDLTGAAEDAQLYLDIARRLAGERRFPAWSAHSEFRAVRARTAAARGAASGGP
jgi:Zn-dependent M28 family amino/carboxypeptidase